MKTKTHLTPVLVFGFVCAWATHTLAQAAQQPAIPHPYESLAPAVTTRVRFVTDFSFPGGPAFQVKVYDWIIGPRQEIANFPLEGFATIEVKAGELETTIGGQTVQRHEGEHWVVAEGARLGIRISSEAGHGDNLVSLRGVVVTRK
jgi:hypothetical protein